MAASGTTGLVLWLVAAAILLGGLIADRTGRRDLVLLAGLVDFAAGLASARAGLSPLAGFAAGLPAGPITALPAAVLRPGTRAAGTGRFWTLYYVVRLAVPWLSGRLAAQAGTAAAAFDAGVAMLAACVALLGAFRAVLARRLHA